MAILIALFAFATIAALAAFVISLKQEDERAAALRLGRYDGRIRSEFEREVSANLAERALRPVIAGAAELAGRFAPAARREAIRRRLMQAGNPWGLQPLEYVGLQGLLAFGVPLLLFILGPGRPSSGGGAGWLLVLIGSGVIASMLLELIIRQRITARRTEIEKGLPDVLDLLTVSVEAGMGFDGSVAKVVEKYRGAIAEEFRRLLQEMRMGKPRRDALKDLGARSGVPDLMSFSVALVQADQLGVGIGRVLRVQSDEMRRRRRQRAEESAMKAPIKMLFPLIIFVFPTLFIVLLGPAAIQITTMFMQMN